MAIKELKWILLVLISMQLSACLKNDLWGRAGLSKSPAPPNQEVIQPVQVNLKGEEYVLSFTKIDPNLKAVIANDFTPNLTESLAVTPYSPSSNSYHFVAINLADPTLSFIVELPVNLTPLDYFFTPNIVKGETQNEVYKAFTNTTTSQISLLKFKIENKTASITNVFTTTAQNYLYYMKLGTQDYAVSGSGFNITFTNLNTLNTTTLPANRRLLTWRPYSDVQLLVAETFGPGFELQLTLYDENLNQISYREFGANFSNISSSPDEKHILFRSFDAGLSTHYKLEIAADTMDPTQMILEAHPTFSTNTTSRYPDCSAIDLSLCVFEIDNGGYQYKIYNTLTGQLLCDISLGGEMSTSIDIESKQARFSLDPMGDTLRIYSLETCQFRTISRGQIHFPIFDNQFLQIDQSGDQLRMDKYDQNNALIESVSAPSTALASAGVTLDQIAQVTLIKSSGSNAYLKFKLYRGWEEGDLEVIYNFEDHTLVPVTVPNWQLMYF